MDREWRCADGRDGSPAISAKDHGRDRVEIHDSKPISSIIQRYDDMQLVSEIQKQPRYGDSSSHCMAQPIVPLVADDGSSRIGIEILLRMKDSKGNRISSSAFFSPLRSAISLMPQVDRWVVSTYAGAPVRICRLPERKAGAIFRHQPVRPVTG